MKPEIELNYLRTNTELIATTKHALERGLRLALVSQVVAWGFQTHEIVVPSTIRVRVRVRVKLRVRVRIRVRVCLCTIFGDVPYYVQRYYLSSATVESVSESNSAPLLFKHSCSYVLMPLLLSTDAT